MIYQELVLLFVEVEHTSAHWGLMLEMLQRLTIPGFCLDLERELIALECMHMQMVNLAQLLVLAE